MTNALKKEPCSLGTGEGLLEKPRASLLRLAWWAKWLTNVEKGSLHEQLLLSLSRRRYAERTQVFRQLSYRVVWLRTSHFSALSLKSPVCETGVMVLLSRLMWRLKERMQAECLQQITVWEISAVSSPSSPSLPLNCSWRCHPAPGMIDSSFAKNFSVTPSEPSLMTSTQQACTVGAAHSIFDWRSKLVILPLGSMTNATVIRTAWLRF